MKSDDLGVADCCQSGCAHCTWDIYMDDLSHWHEQIADVKAQLKDIHVREPIPASEWPTELLGPMEEQAVISKDEAKAKAEQELERERAQLDPSLRLVNPNISKASLTRYDRAFLELEARLKKKQRDK